MLRSVFLSVAGTLIVCGSVLGAPPDELYAKAECDFAEVPLADALQQLAQAYQITIELDEEALSEVGIPTDEPVSCRYSGLRLNMLLASLLHPLGLTTVVDSEGVVEVTTTEVAQKRLETRRYDLKVIRGLERVPPEPIALAVMHATPGPWNLTDGVGGTLRFDGRTLVVEQTARAHEAVATLIRQMTRAAATDPADAPPLTGSERIEQQIRKIMDRPHDATWRRAPLSDVADYVSGEIGALALVDEVALAELGHRDTAPVSMTAQNKPLGDALTEAIADLGLVWLIEDDVIKITSAEIADHKFVTRVYNIVPLAATPEQEQTLRNSIQSLPGLLWEDVDGRGGTLHILGDLLVISQHHRGQRQISELLE